MNTRIKQSVLLVAAVAAVALLAGCQSETTPAPPPENKSASNPAAGPMGRGGSRPTAQVSTGLSAAPSGANTNLQGGMK